MGMIADLLKEIPSAARYKSELEDMEKDNSSLKTQVENLRKEIQRRDDIIQQHKLESHKEPINDVQLKILLSIEESTYQALMEHELLKATKTPQTEFKYHLQELKENGFIEENSSYLNLTQKSRKLIMENKH